MESDFFVKNWLLGLHIKWPNISVESQRRGTLRKITDLQCDTIVSENSVRLQYVSNKTFLVHMRKFTWENLLEVDYIPIANLRWLSRQFSFAKKHVLKKIWTSEYSL